MENNKKFDINEYFEKIRALLRKLGYENKEINIKEAEMLYHTYGEGLSEETFSKEVLNVDENIYKRAKREKRNIRVLTVKDTLSEEQIRELRKKIIKDGYAGKKVNYKEFLEIYEQYGKGLQERTFALFVLDIRCRNYGKLRESAQKKEAKDRKEVHVIILKNVGNIKETKNKMIQDGYEDYLLESYDDFLKLYKMYGYTFTKECFYREILEIGYDEYKTFKMGKKQVRILSPEITQDRIDSLVKVLEENGYKEKMINYQEFLELYSEYGKFFEEKEFAIRVLNLTGDSYKSIKHTGIRAMILKDVIINEKAERIKQTLVEKKYVNKPIGTEELKELYQKYGEDLEEKEFALDVLELPLDSYRGLRRKGNKDRSRILKKQIPKEVERIKKILFENYSNQKEDYDKLHELYQEYGYFLSERQFAMQVLEVNSSSYQTAQYRKKKGLKSQLTFFPIKELTYEEMASIRRQLILDGYENRKITRAQIDELKEIYGKRMTRARFEEEILGICWLRKENKKKVKEYTILSKKDTLDNDTIEELKNKIKQEGYYEKKMKPEKTYELYEKYGEGLTFNTFLYKVLGIKRKQLDDAKAKDKFVTMTDINIKNTLELIENMELKEIRYYQKEEIQRICKKYNISLENFITYTLLKGLENKQFKQDKYIETYKDILDQHDQLWIGKGKVSNDIISKYYYELEKIVGRVIENTRAFFSNAYQYSDDKKDDFQDLLLFFIENGQEVEKNFMVYDRPEWSRYAYGKLRIRMMNMALSRIGKLPKKKNQYVTNKDFKEYEQELADEKSNTEEIVVEGMSRNCVLFFGKLLEEGYTIQEAKVGVCTEFGITELEFADEMKRYMEEQNNRNFDTNVLMVNYEKKKVLKKG